MAHEVDYKIHGDDMQFVEVELDPGESAVAEAGAMMYMSSAIGMETIFGDGSSQRGRGVMGALLGAGKRLLTGESLFMTVFTNQGSGKQHVAFAAPYPGKILAMDLKTLGGALICQKDSFLCAARGVSIGIAFQRRLGVGLAETWNTLDYLAEAGIRYFAQREMPAQMAVEKPVARALPVAA